MILLIWFIIWWSKGFPEFQPWDVWFVTFIISIILLFQRSITITREEVDN